MSYGVEILHPGGGEGLGHLSGRDHAGHGVAVTDGLPHCDDVGNEVFPLKLEGPEVRADAAEAHLDFIGDEDASCFMNVPEDGWKNSNNPGVGGGYALMKSRLSFKTKFSAWYATILINVYSFLNVFGTYLATCWK